MKEALKMALEAAYLAGFNASGEGYNGEYPFGDKMQDPAENRVWKEDRDNYIKEALAQPEQKPVHTAQTSIVFYNGNSPSEESEVLRITKEGITVNPAFQTDEAAAAVLRALGSQIKEILAQPEQEPVAHCEGGAEFCPVCLAETRSLALTAAIGYIQRNTPSLVSTEICNALNRIPDAKKVVAQPEQERNFCPRCGKRVGSNDWDVHTCTPPQPEQHVSNDFDFGADIELAYKEIYAAQNAELAKALAQPAQQPCDMGEMCIGCSPRNADGSCPGTKLNGACDCYVNGFNDGMKEMDGMGPYELRPAQRTWVGLTDEKIEEIAAKTLFPVPFARAIEAELKE